MSAVTNEQVYTAGFEYKLLCNQTLLRCGPGMFTSEAVEM